MAHSNKQRRQAFILKILIGLAIAIAMGSLLLVIVQVLMQGIPHLNGDIFNPTWTTENQSMMPAIWNTLLLILITLVLTIPVGVATAIYTVEYAKPGSKFVAISRLMTETLQGIPSIIFGLFGMIFFVNTIGWGNAIISGALTMWFMTLPLVIRSTEEALMAVPMSLREASYGLGATKLRTTFQVVLPAAAMGIFSGIILTIGRIVGETAALIYTAGSMAQYASPMLNGRTLAIHMYLLQTEGIHKDQAYATAVILLLVVLAINGLSTMIQNAYKKKETGNDD
ncbi:phosphate ABC transporter permease PstA [Kallipyga massiliensis]|uniref:phosphate ABC transporter permease PstA n=1 Tax=Kallipyga massiliensis TaxID=1472764 RepID=UPI0026EDF091|nr:phosphate ABC transporter permease PstA [Kallipyga massiliensis]